MTAPRRELVEAGAGCGKTYSLVSRFIEALGYDSETGKRNKEALLRPDKIVALTFTEAAAAQMKERILERLRSFDLHDLAAECQENAQISTFHSLCYKLLQPHLFERGYLRTEIQSSHFARKKRWHFLREKIYRTSSIHEIFEFCQLKDLEQWSQDLFFYDLDTFKIQEHKKLEHFKECFDQNLKEISLEIENFLTQNSISDQEDCWPQQLNDALSTQNLEALSSLNLRKNGKPNAKKEAPQLYEKAKLLKALVQKNLDLSLSEESLKQEKRGKNRILSFFKKLFPHAPKILDFQALEFEFLKLLEEKSLDELGLSIELIMVDEFQDTNETQYKILQKLSRPHTQWYFVGDPKQSIYSFRGGDIRLYERLRSELTLLHLSKNWRTERKLLDLINTVQSHLFPQKKHPEDPHPQILEAVQESSSDENSPSLRTYSFNKEQRHKKLLEALLKRESEIPSCSHGVLFRSWKELYSFSGFLKDQNKNFKILGQESHLDHALTDLFTAFIESCENPENPLGLEFSLFYLNTKKSQEEMRSFFESASLKTYSWPELLLHWSLILETSRWPEGRNWTQACALIIEDLFQRGLQNSWNLKDLAEELKNKRLESCPTLLSKEGPVEGWDLSLMTIHGSKGLEFDCVYLNEFYTRSSGNREDSIIESQDQDISFALKYWLPQKGLEQKSLLDRFYKHERTLQLDAEQKRLFYVALTRCKKRMDLFIPEEKSSKSLSPEPTKLLNWPSKRRSYWASFCSDLFSSQDLSQLQVLEKDKQSTEEESQSQEVWHTPSLVMTPSLSNTFFNGGVSSYLAQEETNPKESQKTFSLSSKQKKWAQWGTRLHEILQYWTGDLEELKKQDLDEDFFQACSTLRNFSELGEYWQERKIHPQNFHFEASLIIQKENEYELSGIADVLWMKSPEELMLIDWKSASSALSFEKPERIEKIEKQLSLYADSFRTQFKKIQIQAVAIYPKDSKSWEAKTLINTVI